MSFVHLSLSHKNSACFLEQIHAFIGFYAMQLQETTTIYSMKSHKQGVGMEECKKTIPLPHRGK